MIFSTTCGTKRKDRRLYGGDVLQGAQTVPGIRISIEEYKESKLMSGAIGYFPKDFNPITNENGDIDILTPGWKRRHSTYAQRRIVFRPD